jgi:4-amino-4-deoxy-L-arabinose transferase-like glycosyltransferase
MKEPFGSTVRSNNEPFSTNARGEAPARPLTAVGSDEARNRSRRATICLAVILVGAALLYYLTLKPDRLGEYHDDSVYVATAKALAEGRGYKIISLPYQPAETKYPPLHPFLLSLVWRIAPSFPGNLVWMMLMSSMAAIGFLGLTYRYFTRFEYAGPWQAVLIVALTAVNLRTTILATTTASEMIFSMAAMAGLYLAELYVDEKQRWTGSILVGVMIGLCVLARGAGVALLVATPLYYLVRRQWRRGFVILTVGGLFVAGWVVWSSINRTAIHGEGVAFYTSYSGVIREAFGEARALSGSSFVAIGLEVIGRNAIGLIVLSVPIVCSSLNEFGMGRLGTSIGSVGTVSLLLFVFVFTAIGFIRQLRPRPRLLHVYVICYFGLYVLLPYSTYDRYLAPLLPLLLLFFTCELATAGRLVQGAFSSKGGRAGKLAAALTALLLFVGVIGVAYNYGSGAWWTLKSASWKKRAGPSIQDAEAIEWIRENTRPDDVLVCDRDPVYYLYTGRKATRAFKEDYLIEQEHAPIEEKVKIIRRIIRESGGEYLITNWTDIAQESHSGSYDEAYRVLLGESPREFSKVFQARDWATAIYRVRDHTGVE